MRLRLTEPIRAERQQTTRVVVAMEGVNGWARPLDQRIQRRGWE